MLVQIIVTPRLLNSLPGQGYTYLYTRTTHPDAFSPDALAVLQRWAWFGAVGPHLFRLGASYLSVDNADVVAATHAFEPLGQLDSPISAPRTLVCDASGMTVAVPAGTAVTLEFGATTPGDSMSLAVDGRWLPAERTVVVASDHVLARGAGPWVRRRGRPRAHWCICRSTLTHAMG